MSLLSKYVGRQVKKHGLKNFILKVLTYAAKLTPGKKDDRMVAELKKVLNKY